MRLNPIVSFVVALLVFICGLTGGIIMLVFGTMAEPSTSPSSSSQVFIAVICTVYSGWVAEVSDGDSSWYAVIYNASFPYDSETTVWGWLSNDTEQFQTQSAASAVLASRPTLPPFTCYYDPKQLDFERTTNPIWAVNPQAQRSSPGSLNHSGALALIIIGSILMAASTAVFIAGMVIYVKGMRKGHPQARLNPFSHKHSSDYNSYTPPTKNEVELS